MQTFVIPAGIWFNLVILVAAAIFVWAKIAMTKKTEQKRPERKQSPSGLRLAKHSRP